MSETAVQEYIDSPDARAELACFLEQTGQGQAACSWPRRLAHWWDENPHAALEPTRGHIARHQGCLVAFGGVIPQAYQHDGKIIPALLGTTFRVLPGHVRAGMSILLAMRRRGRHLMIVQTTPLPRLQQVMQKMGARAETRVTRRLYPLGRLAHMQALARPAWPVLPPGVKVITDPAQARAMAAPVQPLRGLQKAASLENLRWQLASPAHRLRFLGAVDDEGSLHSHLILRQATVMRFFHAWEVVESWTARPNPEELLALAGCLVRQPNLCGRPCRWLSSVSFPADTTWQSAPAVLQHQEKLCHHYLMPAALQAAPLHPMLAEGDLFL